MRSPPNSYEARLTSAWHRISDQVMKERERERRLANEKAECEQILKELFDRRNTIVAKLKEIDNSCSAKIKSIDDFLADINDYIEDGNVYSDQVES